MKKKKNTPSKIIKQVMDYTQLCLDDYESRRAMLAEDLHEGSISIDEFHKGMGSLEAEEITAFEIRRILYGYQGGE
jgi:hypothetical protein